MMTAATDFHQIVKQLGQSFRYLHRSFVAVRHGLFWEIRHSRAFFAAVEPNPYPINVAVTTPSVLAYRTVEKISDPLSMIMAFSKDPYATAPRELIEIYRAHTGQTATFFRLYPPDNPGAMRLPSLRFECAKLAQPGATELAQIQIELLAADEPFENLEDLYAALNINPDKADDSAHSIIDIILGPIAQIEPTSNLSNGTLEVIIRAAEDINPPDIKVGLKIFGQNEVNRFSVKGNAISWNRENEIIAGSFSVDAPNAPLVLATLSYRGEFLHRWYIRDNSISFNRRLDLHRPIDKDDRFVNSFYDHKTDFEERIGLLLNLLGLDCLQYGKIPLLTEAPDILALSSTGDLYVVECTTGDINAKGKLQKLKDRVKLIQDSLQNTPAKPSIIIPVVFTSLSRQETSAHWGTARSLSISIMSREDIDIFLTQLASPPSAESFNQTIMDGIPST